MNQRERASRGGWSRGGQDSVFLASCLFTDFLFLPTSITSLFFPPPLHFIEAKLFLPFGFQLLSTSRKHSTCYSNQNNPGRSFGARLSLQTCRLPITVTSTPSLILLFAPPHRTKALSSGALGAATEHHNWLALLPITDLEQFDSFLDRPLQSASPPVRAGRSTATRLQPIVVQPTFFFHSRHPGIPTGLRHIT